MLPRMRDAGDKNFSLKQGPFIGQLSRGERDRERKKKQKKLPNKVYILFFFKLFNSCQNYPPTPAIPLHSEKKNI